MTVLAPLHLRIRADIETRILSGELKPGDRIPSEAELGESYACARMTVNKALTALAAAGLIERRKRAGSFVARPRAVSMVLDVPDLPGEVAARGQNYGWRLTSRDIVRSPAGAFASGIDRASGISGASGTSGNDITGRLLRVEGIHLADDVPFAFEQRFISLLAVPDIAGVDFKDEPPGSWLLRHIPWNEAENRIGAVAASEQLARALNIAPGSPCLQMERRTWRDAPPRSGSGAQTITFVRQSFVAGSHVLVARFGPGREGTRAPPTRR